MGVPPLRTGSANSLRNPEIQRFPLKQKAFSSLHINKNPPRDLRNGAHTKNTVGRTHISRNVSASLFVCASFSRSQGLSYMLYEHQLVRAPF